MRSMNKVQQKAKIISRPKQEEIYNKQVPQTLVFSETINYILATSQTVSPLKLTIWTISTPPATSLLLNTNQHQFISYSTYLHFLSICNG